MSIGRTNIVRLESHGLMDAECDQRPRLQVPQVTPFGRPSRGFAVGPASRAAERWKGPPADCIGAHLPTNEDIAMFGPDNTKAGLPCVSVCIMCRTAGRLFLGIRLWRPDPTKNVSPDPPLFSLIAVVVPPESVGRQTSDVIDTDANPLLAGLIMYSWIGS